MKRRRYAPGVVLLLLLAVPREPGADRQPGPWITPAVLSIGEQARLQVTPPDLAVEVDLVNVNLDERKTFELSLDGEVRGEVEELEHFFRCKRSGRTHEMDPGVLSLLAHVGAQWPGRPIEVVSGYRKRGYGVSRSKHYFGRAIDFRVRGVPVAKVRRFLWRNHAEIGLGHYLSQGYLHIDHRPGEYKVGWVQRREGASYRYKPWWTGQ